MTKSSARAAGQRTGRSMVTALAAARAPAPISTGKWRSVNSRGGSEQRLCRVLVPECVQLFARGATTRLGERAQEDAAVALAREPAIEDRDDAAIARGADQAAEA